LEVVNLHDAKVIGLNGGLQGGRGRAHGFGRGKFDQHGPSWLAVHFLGGS
jgi:hypothetical protein